MVVVETILDWIPAVGVTVALVYYTLTIRNQNRTRQAQLLMGLYETYRSPTFRKQMDDVMFRMEWEDYEDFMRKYDANINSEERTSWFSVAAFFEGVGVLVKRRLIDISLVDDLLANSIRRAWEKIGPIETRSRETFNSPRLFDDFEYLHNELMKYHKDHPELKS